MLKERTQAVGRKKKARGQPVKSIRSPLYEQPGNYLMKFTEMLLSPKCSGSTLKAKQGTKEIKSANVTPGCKSRKSSK